jgi:OFA family oxalate/formate antiporter-like MFS transporter
LFGSAAGVGYGLSVQISTASAFGDGVSVGLVTSARAAGAFLFAPVVRHLLDVGGVGYAMRCMGFLLLSSAVPLFLMLNAGGLDTPMADPRRDKNEEISPEQQARDATLRPAMAVLWATLGLGVSSGLMVISHAAALLFSHGASIGVATAGVSIVSACTTLGRVAGGWACDRTWCGPARVLRLAPLIAAPALAWASASGTSVLAAQCALAAASLTYGAMGSAVPTEVRRRVGPGNFARAYGKVYTAWGLAGLGAPSAAGLLYDYQGNYVAALAAATGLCLASAAAAAALKPGRSHEEWEEVVGIAAGSPVNAK